MTGWANLKRAVPARGEGLIKLRKTGRILCGGTERKAQRSGGQGRPAVRSSEA